MGMSLTERKIFPVMAIKSISQTTGNVSHVLRTVQNTLDVALVIYLVINNVLDNMQ